MILGVDPGTRRCGYGVVDARAQGLAYVECGVIEMPARAPLSERLAELQNSLREVVEELRPTVMAVEEVFHGIDARAALVLGHARGVVLAVAGARGLPVFAYPPATVKRSVTGAGRAPKSQVASVVRSLLKLRRVPSADAADALAVAICHAHHTTMMRLRAASRLSQAKGVRR
ncbi:MAG TPA: crossover junction endodeoxyribonuclease RuvC [Polyangia bacterium]|nr:crossover junction endodeoxyribonuclease RuvC [Polyangia bacterium]